LVDACIVWILPRRSREFKYNVLCKVGAIVSEPTVCSVASFAPSRARRIHAFASSHTDWLFNDTPPYTVRHQVQDPRRGDRQSTEAAPRDESRTGHPNQLYYYRILYYAMM
jgi:hypothetical protein